MPSVRQIGEYALVEGLCRRLSAEAQGREDILLGIGDDAAVVQVEAGANMVLTTDALIEGVHFQRHWMLPYQLGWKSVAVNFSDLAALFAEPRYVLITMGLTGEETSDFVDEFYHGASDMAGQFQAVILGGDTVRVPQSLTVSVTVVGFTDAQPLPARSGAKPGDLIIATGFLGDSAVGLQALLQPERTDVPDAESLQHVITRHLMPKPRIAEALAVKQSGGCHAAIDVSDGLASDLKRLAEASGVGIEVWFSHLPISPSALTVGQWLGMNPLDAALYGGEDYELLLSVPESDTSIICERIKSQTGTQASIIGKVTDAPTGVWGRDQDGRLVPLSGGYEHFFSATPHR